MKNRKKPNILWIMSDEHNHEIMGCYGNRVIQTPHMDSLAARGITFDTHYCNSPLCAPSRLSLTAGKYTSRVDVWGLTSELPSADTASLPRVLNSSGYQSFLCGKRHYEALHEQDRDSVLRELFHPTEGARFTYCRTPIGANDFSIAPTAMMTPMATSS